MDNSERDKWVWWTGVIVGFCIGFYLALILVGYSTCQ